MDKRIFCALILALLVGACTDRIVQPGDGVIPTSQSGGIVYTAADSTNLDHSLVVLADSLGLHPRTVDTASLRYSVGKNCVLWKSAWIMSPFTIARADGSIIRHIYPDADPLVGGAVSGDGSYVAYRVMRYHPAVGTALLQLESVDGSSSITIDSFASANGFEVFAPDNSAIIYERLRTDSTTHADLVRYTIASGQSRTVLSDIHVVGPFAVSPKGDIACVTTGELLGELHVYTKDGLPITTIADACFPSWSPDGKKFVFCKTSAIMISFDNGVSASPLTYGFGTPYLPTWSEDGTRLLFGLVNSEAGSVKRCDLYEYDFTFGRQRRVAPWGLYGFYLR